MRTFFIIRHADKEIGNFYNSRLRHQDQPISEKGRRDAQRLCSFFAVKPIKAIYISEYQRTWQTIEGVAIDHRLAPVIDSRLNEIDNGLFDGKTEEELRQAFPLAWNAYLARKADFRFPDGETGAEAQARIASFLEEKRREHGDEDIVLATHEGLIRLLMCYIVHLPVYLRGNFRVDTCGITEIIYQPEYESWKLIRFNQV